MRHCNRLSGEAIPGGVQGQMGLWAAWSIEVSLPTAGGWNQITFKVPPNPKHSVILFLLFGPLKSHKFKGAAQDLQ